MKSALIASAFFFAISSDAQTGITAPVITPTNLHASATEILKQVQSPDFTSASCVDYLKSIENQIMALEVAQIPESDFQRDAQAIADLSWSIRESLHRRMFEFDAACVNQIQSNFRQFRFVEEFFLERLYKIADLYPENYKFMTPDAPTPMRTDKNFFIFRKSAAGIAAGVTTDVTRGLSPGDLLISRGISFLSGMIARLGIRGTQFSHVVMLADNGPVKNLAGEELANAQRSVESYVGSGVSFYEINDALKNENARILWLRSKDRELAARASNWVSNQVAELKAKNDKIYYDYQLDFKNHETMSCAEVAQTAYEVASQNATHIPFYENEIKGAESLLNHIQLPAGPTFEPGDMEIDPRFELMGEFTDLRLTRDSRHKDVIMTKIFEWMDTRGYELHDSMKSKMAGGVIFKVRKTFLWPVVKKLLKIDDFSKEIPAAMLRTVTLLGQIGEPMLAELRERDAAYEKKTGWKMTYPQLYQVMEELRERDEALYQSGRKGRKQSKFHAFFR